MTDSRTAENFRGLAPLEPEQAGGGGGGWNFVTSQTAANDGTIDFENMVDDFDYKYTFLTIFPATDGAKPQALLGIAGPTYRTSLYTGAGVHLIETGPAHAFGFATSVIDLAVTTNVGSSTNEGIYRYDLELAAPASSSLLTAWDGEGSAGLSTDGRTFYIWSRGQYTVAEAQTSIRFKFSSGNITSGLFMQFRRARS